MERVDAVECLILLAIPTFDLRKVAARLTAPPPPFSALSEFFQNCAEIFTFPPFVISMFFGLIQPLPNTSGGRLRVTNWPVYGHWMLTGKAVRAAASKEKAYKLAGSLGLRLHKSPRGHKSWRYEYRFKKKGRLLTFGACPGKTGRGEE